MQGKGAREERLMRGLDSGKNLMRLEVDLGQKRGFGARADLRKMVKTGKKVLGSSLYVVTEEYQ